LNPRGIRVTGYIPGVVKTDIIKEMLATEPERLVAQISLRRLAEPEEIATLALFLASDAAAYINGSMVEMSGGKLCVQNPGRYRG
jgi:3-oxoacyl-[acyl-carrier protein] reductase